MRISRRQLLVGLGATVALTAAAAGRGQAQDATSAADVATPSPTPVRMSERMVRLSHRPVTEPSNILEFNSRIPCVVTIDADGNFLHGSISYEDTPASQEAPAVAARPPGDAAWIAAQYQYTASTTKVIALLAAIDWIKEQALGPAHPEDAAPADALLHPDLAPYARVLGRPVSLRPDPNTGGIEFADDVIGNNSITSLTVDEILRFSMQFSTNDLLACLDRKMQQQGGVSLGTRMQRVCDRLNMQDSRFVTVHGMSAQEGGARVDCYSTPAEMLHALRVLDQLHPNFAPYLGITLYEPANPQLARVRPAGFSTAVQWVEGPRSGTAQMQFASLGQAAPNDAALGTELGTELAMADDAVAQPASTEGGGDTPDDIAAAGQADDEADNGAEPLAGISGVQLMKPGLLGARSRPVTRVVRRNGRRVRRVVGHTPHTQWRTGLGKAVRMVNGVAHTVYFWVSADTASRRVASIEEALVMSDAAIRQRALQPVPVSAPSTYAGSGQPPMLAAH